MLKRIISFLRKKFKKQEEVLPGEIDWLQIPPIKGIPPSEIEYRLRKSKRHKPKPKQRFFKPRSAHEKRLWKEDVKPED